MHLKCMIFSILNFFMDIMNNAFPNVHTTQLLVMSNIQYCSFGCFNDLPGYKFLP